MCIKIFLFTCIKRKSGNNQTIKEQLNKIENIVADVYLLAWRGINDILLSRK